MNRTIAAIAALVVTGAALLDYGATTAHAAVKPSLPVVLSASADGASAAWDKAGDIVLKPGTVTASTYARVSVDLTKLGLATAPAAPPSFTTSAYAAGSPRWVIELANGNWVTGYPAQLGAGATVGLTGPQWAVGNSGTYQTYAAALAGAGDPLGNVQVTAAYVVADGDQAAGTADALAGVQYDGETAVPPAVPVVLVLSHGHASASNNRAVVTWTATPDKASGYTVTIVGPNYAKGRTANVTRAQAYYSGLAAGHNYTVTVQGYYQGKPSGKPGHVTFATTR